MTEQVIEFDDYALIKGAALPPRPEGYIIKCQIDILSMDLSFAPLELGVFPADDVEVVTKVIETLANMTGETNRMEVRNFVCQFAKWPEDSKGIPAWLENFAIIYHDGEGGEFIMTSKELE